MYFIAKLLQAAGLTLVLIGFLRRFPELMDMQLLGIGVAIFIFGWIAQQFLLKR